VAKVQPGGRDRPAARPPAKQKWQVYSNSCMNFRRGGRQPLAKSLPPLQERASGEMAEWLKAHAWKACVRETVPWVRIPLSPPYPWWQADNCKIRPGRPLARLTLTGYPLRQQLRKHLINIIYLEFCRPVPEPARKEHNYVTRSVDNAATRSTGEPNNYPERQYRRRPAISIFRLFRLFRLLCAKSLPSSARLSRREPYIPRFAFGSDVAYHGVSAVKRSVNCLMLSRCNSLRGPEIRIGCR
jgi:hypothetical protein